MMCVICGELCPPTCSRGLARWGERKYCSKKCIKTAYRRNHPEKDKASKQKYLENYPEKRKLSSDDYRKRNAGYYREYASLRTRYLKQSKPKWLNELETLWIAEIYDLAIKTNKEVDHIVPLKNPKVCGLHVPWNLQLLSRTENAKKNNKFDEDLICVIKG